MKATLKKSPPLWLCLACVWHSQRPSQLDQSAQGRGTSFSGACFIWWFWFFFLGRCPVLVEEAAHLHWQQQAFQPLAWERYQHCTSPVWDYTTVWVLLSMCYSIDKAEVVLPTYMAGQKMYCSDAWLRQNKENLFWCWQPPVNPVPPRGRDLGHTSH